MKENSSKYARARKLFKQKKHEMIDIASRMEEYERSLSQLGAAEPETKLDSRNKVIQWLESLNASAKPGEKRIEIWKADLEGDYDSKKEVPLKDLFKLCDDHQQHEGRNHGIRLSRWIKVLADYRGSDTIVTIFWNFKPIYREVNGVFVQ